MKNYLAFLFLVYSLNLFSQNTLKFDTSKESVKANIQDVSLNGLKIYVYGNRISSLRKYFRSENTAIQVSQIGSQVNQIQTSIPFKIENISSKKWFFKRRNMRTIALRRNK